MESEHKRIHKVMKHFETLDPKAERAEFGAWISSYLDDAGYSTWMMYPDIYKMMIMTAFPPLEELDNLIGHEQRQLNPAEFEQRMLSWLQVLDIHMQSHKTAKQDVSSWL